MKEMHINTRRRLLHGLCGTAALPLLSSCGTLLYPARVNQEEHGGLDPAIVILDGIGLFFFLIPGIIAFAVDFGTGAIYYPAGRQKGDREETILDRWKEDATQSGMIDREAIERFIAEQTGQPINLDEAFVLVEPLDRLEQFSAVSRQLTARHALARN
jgi:hypothetical protein